MKQLLTTLTLLLTTPLLAQNSPYIHDYLERLENSRNYIIAVAEQMPEAHYEYRVTPDSFSFAENLMHIGFAMNWHGQALIGGQETKSWQEDTLYKTAGKSKAQMIAVVHQTFDATMKTLKAFDTSQMDDELDYFGLTRSKRQIFMLLSDHITHHRAQMLVAMRLKGLVPPRYVLYQ